MSDVNNINYEATRVNFYDEGYNQAAIARKLSVSKAAFSQVLLGTYPSMNGPTAGKVLAWLRDRGLLVERPEDKAA